MAKTGLDEDREAAGETRRNAARLRSRAERRLRGHGREPHAPDPEDIPRLVHELEVHQIELEMQNEELRETHRRLEDQLRKFAELYEGAPNGYLTVDPQGVVRQLNSAAAELLGDERPRLLGKRLDILLRFEDPRVLQAFLDDVLFSGERRVVEFELRGGRRARTLRVAATASPEREECRLMAEDITELKLAQAELLRAKEAAEEAGRAKDRFLARLSHELRTPLSPALGAAQTLEAEPALDAQSREAAGMIRRNVEMEARLVDDLLDLGRILAGKLSLVTAQVDVHAVIREAARICEPEIRSKGLHLSLRLDAAGAEIRGDGGRLRQVLWNLLGNAAKFTPPSGCISVATLDAPGGVLRVEVRDSGMGIEPGELSSIFEPFEQGRAGASQGGLGLGLAISRSIAELHKGSLVARSEGRGRGSTLILELPAGPGATGKAQEPPLEPPRRAKRLRVLLVEDHGDTADVYSALLRRNGCDVVCARDTASALEAARREPFDLLLSDLLLPDGTGHQLLRRIREEVRPIKAIALSGLGMEEDVARSREAGFAEHLTKPVLLEELLQAIRRVAGGDRSD